MLYSAFPAALLLVGLYDPFCCAKHVCIPLCILLYVLRLPLAISVRHSAQIIVISKLILLKRYSKAKRTRTPAYSLALRRIKGGFSVGGSRESLLPSLHNSFTPN